MSRLGLLHWMLLHYQLRTTPNKVTHSLLQLALLHYSLSATPDTVTHSLLHLALLHYPLSAKPNVVTHSLLHLALLHYPLSATQNAVESLKNETNNVTIMLIPHAYLHTIYKTHATLKKTWDKTVGGVALTKVTLIVICDAEKC